MMDVRWVAGAIALGAALLFTPLVKRICMRLRLYDLPGPLKIHSHPIPRLGGISLALAFGLALSFAKCFAEFPARPLFIALALIWLTGLADDLRGLSPWVRLVTQIASATLLWHEGWRVPLLGGVFSWMATCLFVIAFVNALNFLDGADGLATGTAAIIAVGFAALPAGMLSHLGAAVAWSLLGASLGFLAFNFPPAKIFLGDSGSTVLGFSLAFLALDSCRAGASANFLPLFPVIFAAVPLLDAAFAVLRRLRNHDSPLAGDRRHFYDLLLAHGWSPRRVSFLCYSITAALIAAGWLSVRGGFAQAVWISALCFGALLAAALRLGALRSKDEVLEMQEEKKRHFPETCCLPPNVLPFSESKNFLKG
jgi:UDP-GlcNAc:undecaprenyl-phosphate GlcNAc-1-phosphate transferase